MDFYPRVVSGHMGIADSRGVIYDFAGPYTIGEDHMAFGRPTRFLQLDPERCRGEHWDEAVARSSETYRFGSTCSATQRFAVMLHFERACHALGGPFLRSILGVRVDPPPQSLRRLEVYMSYNSMVASNGERNVGDCNGIDLRLMTYKRVGARRR